jgi:hypothetical protein
MRSIHRSGAALVAVVFALAACNDESDRGEPAEQASDVSVLGDETSDEPEVDDEPEPERETDEEPEAPANDNESDSDEAFAFPDEIDNDYVDSLLNLIVASSTRLLGDIITRDPAPLREEDVSLLQSLYSGPRLEFMSDDYERYALSESERTVLLAPDAFGVASWSNQEIVIADESCIVAIGWHDLTEVAQEPFSRDIYMVASLTPSNESSSNDTGWTMHDINPLVSDGYPIPRPSWSDVDFSRGIAHTCEDDPVG